MDKICIKDLEIYCHHGVLKEENILGQKFLVSATLFTDVSKAGASDEICDSINYAQVSHFIEEFMKNNTCKLIETVACKLANELLMEFSLIDSITLMVKKPWAPILLPLDTVSVEVTRGWHEAYLAIGSNMGDKEENLKQALDKLGTYGEIRVLKVSSIITTKPYGPVEQEDFKNGALMIQTILSPKELLDVLHEVEQDGGRTREVHWGPRTIDLDILLYDDKIMETKELTIPHIDMHNRDFVLEPMCEIAPWTIHPVFRKTMTELREDLQRG